MRFHPLIYRKFVGRVSPDARPGDIVGVYGTRGDIFGRGLYNPNANLVLRMLHFKDTAVDETYWRATVDRAVDLRRNLLRLNETSNAYRLIHAEGDQLSGMLVDRYDDTLSLSVHSYGMWQQLDHVLPLLHEAADTKHHFVEMPDRIQQLEGCNLGPMSSDALPNSVNIEENGVRFRVHFDGGHKTGFFCDQRDNRLMLSKLVGGAEVLDLCCYTGGFGIYAKKLGEAKRVVCVDLDENAVALAKKNANLNQVRIETAHADGFIYIRQMIDIKREFDAVVLDPPKLIFGRGESDQGRHKYADLNRLAATLVRSGGLLVTCSCSGALPREEFNSIAVEACRRAGRNVQILNQTGASPDHPIAANCPESEYLKVLWLRLT
jgi:23S rRNA (cytosine1962-C5)-methyltransferase